MISSPRFHPELLSSVTRCHATLLPMQCWKIRDTFSSTWPGPSPLYYSGHSARVEKLEFMFSWFLMSFAGADPENYWIKGHQYFSSRAFCSFLNPDQIIFFFFLWKLKASLHFGFFTNNVLRIIPLLINTYQRGLCGQDPEPAQTSGLHCFSWSCTPAEGLVWNANLVVAIHLNHPPAHDKRANTYLYSDRVRSQKSHTIPLHNVHRRLEPNSWTSVFIKQPFIVRGYIWLPCVVFRCSAPNICRHWCIYFNAQLFNCRQLWHPKTGMHNPLECHICIFWNFPQQYKQAGVCICLELCTCMYTKISQKEES